MFEPWIINIIAFLLAFAGLIAVLRTTVKNLEKDVDTLNLITNSNKINISNLETENKQFLKYTDIDSRFASKESVKSLENLCDKQFHNIIELIKRLENKIDIQAKKN